jgi:hypothetical protein
MVSDAAEDVAQVGFGVEAVELRGRCYFEPAAGHFFIAASVIGIEGRETSLTGSQ